MWLVFNEKFINFVINQIELLQFEGSSNKWTKIGVNIGICLGNNQRNFQLHRYTTSENIAESFLGATFLTHTVYRAGFSRQYTMTKLSTGHNRCPAPRAFYYSSATRHRNDRSVVCCVSTRNVRTAEIADRSADIRREKLLTRTDSTMKICRLNSEDLTRNEAATVICFSP